MCGSVWFFALWKYIRTSYNSGSDNVSKFGSHNWKKTGPEPDQTVKSQMRQLQFMVFRNKKLHATGSVQIGCNRFTVPLKMRKFWAYFEDKQARIAWSVAKMICYAEIRLCATSCTCVFWHLEDFYHHKNFIGKNYTQYTIVYRTVLGQFFAVVVHFFLYFCTSVKGATIYIPSECNR